MLYAQIVVITLTTVGTIVGFALAYYEPAAPLLVYWLTVSVSLGLMVSLLPSLGGVEHRLKYVVWIFAISIAVSLITTQLAAGRTISPTHLVYRGVHLVGVESFTIGSGTSDADVRLQMVSSAQVPWLIQLRFKEGAWELEPRFGVEQIQLRSASEPPDEHDFIVARSALLRIGDSVTVLDGRGETVDTLRLSREGIEGGAGLALSLTPSSSSISGRYRRWLRHGTALANLDGTRTDSSIVYERFVRIQEIDDRETVNGDSIPFALSLLPHSRRYLISAMPPFGLAGDAVKTTNLLVRDSGLIDVRNGSYSWRFELLADWRREPGAPRGVSIRFNRHPRPVETPLPAGVNCPVGSACGAISLRRLPPPIPHIALDQAGFDPERFGLVGSLRALSGGYEVVLPKETYRIGFGNQRPTAVPVSPLGLSTGSASEAAGEHQSRWILLEAAGQQATIIKAAIIGIALAALLFSIQGTVRTVALQKSAPLSLPQERAIGIGLTALLGLVLTRVTVGARVTFFDPFLDRGIGTAVGLCVAIAVVAVGLLTWPAWLPRFIASAHSAFGGQLSARRAILDIGLWTRDVFSQAAKPSRRLHTFSTIVSLVLLSALTGLAPVQGLLAGVAVLLVWVCLAWVISFTGRHVDTYERGAQSLIEQLSGRGLRPLPSARASAPEVYLVITFVALTIAHWMAGVGFVVSALVLGSLVVRARWRANVSGRRLPDYLAASVGVAGFAACVAGLRHVSANGSLGVFVLVIFAALASVRIGRGVADRLQRQTSVSTLRHVVSIDSVLLLSPILLLVPLAAIDMGLALVLVIPLGLASLIAAGWRTVRWLALLPGLAMVVLIMLAVQVLFPLSRLEAIRGGNSHVEQAAAFDRLSTIFGLRLPSLERAAARSVATHDRPLAEALLVAAAPGAARDLLLPSIEQIWGAKAYASAGLWGDGLGQATIGGRGVAETVAYAENTFAVFVLSEHGAVGATLVLALYGLLMVAVVRLALRTMGGTPAYRASRTLFMVAALIVVFPACYVALSNVGQVPITGQNMPFLGLNAWSDVAICAGVIGILITGTLRAVEEPVR